MQAERLLPIWFAYLKKCFRPGFKRWTGMTADEVTSAGRSSPLFR